MPSPLRSTGEGRDRNPETPQRFPLPPTRPNPSSAANAPRAKKEKHRDAVHRGARPRRRARHHRAGARRRPPLRQGLHGGLHLPPFPRPRPLRALQPRAFPPPPSPSPSPSPSMPATCSTKCLFPLTRHRPTVFLRRRRCMGRRSRWRTARWWRSAPTRCSARPPTRTSPSSSSATPSGNGLLSESLLGTVNLCSCATAFRFMSCLNDKLQRNYTHWSGGSRQEHGGGSEGDPQCVRHECSWSLRIATLPLRGDHLYTFLHGDMEAGQFLWEDSEQSTAWTAHTLLTRFVMLAWSFISV